MSAESGHPQGKNVPEARARARAHLTLAEALQVLAMGSEDFAVLFEHGTLKMEIYRPRGVDPQQPHGRDEVYVIASGHGFFVNGDVRHAFGTGDVLFVPAGAVHRFEGFSEDFSTWVMFYGPKDGERDDG
ncbi:MAG TPA: cupin domain-containing protein [Rhodanobacteraceae bacterium]|nr:cupin domain-containing protein [Rhodanobacteraceae bacterium]